MAQDIEAANSPLESNEENSKAADALSVSAALALAKKSLEALVVRVVGEVSEVSVKPGYKAAYFTIKDEDASLSCMMWNNRYRAQGIDLQVGQLVQVTGRFSLYVAKGRMNFEAFAIELAGEGDLRLRVANIARKLSAEGLTDPSRKIPLPAFPERIGLVTSPRGAAVHDVLRTLRRRFPLATVYLAGVPVEGAHAAEGIIEGMRCVYRKHPDVILIVRGGGSFEDLMPFNDEALARAICKCPIPVVTGIGHEVDTTIADMVSDFRASTPTAAAEAISPSMERLQEHFSERALALNRSVQLSIERVETHVEHVANRPVFADPMLLFSSEAQTLDHATDRLARALPLQVERLQTLVEAASGRLSRALPANVERQAAALEVASNRLGFAMPQNVARHRDALAVSGDRLKRFGPTALDRFTWQLAQAAGMLENLSPLNTLARGYSITRTSSGDVVRNVSQAPAGSTVRVTVSDGFLDCLVEASQESGQHGESAKGAGN